MALISEKDAEHLRKEFESELESPVKLVMFIILVCGFGLVL